MKPFTKICLILCGILVLLGFTGIGISLAMGVQPRQLLNLAHYPGKFEVHELSGKKQQPDDSGNAAGNTFTKEYYEFGSISEIDMDFSICNLTLKHHSKDVVALEVQNAGDTFRFYQDEQHLSLEDDREPFEFNSLDQSLFLTVYLPDQVFEAMNIKIGVGDIWMDDPVQIQDLYLECGVGDLNINDLTCETAELSSGVGDLTLKALTVTTDASLESGTGDIDIQFYDGPKLDLECGMGNASVTACGKSTDYTYNLDCDLGKLYVPHIPETHHGERHKDTGHRLSSEHHADRSLELHCGVGDLTLYFTEEE